MRYPESNGRYRLRRVSIRVTLAVMLLPGAVSPAGAWEYVKLRMSTSLRTDNNVFRLPEGSSATTASGAPARGDVITTVAIGASVEIPISRQRLALSYDINRFRYANFSGLDFDARDGKAIWNWEAGRLLTGSAGLTQTKSISDFSTTIGRVANVLTVTREFFNVNYPFHTNWQLNGGASHAKVSNSQTLNRVSDNDATSLNGELRYVTGNANYLGLFWTRNAVDFPNALTAADGTRFDNSYKQNAGGATAGYNVSGVSNLQASVSRSQRDPAQAGSSSSTATTGSLAFNWLPTGMTTIGLRLARDFAPPDNVTVTGSVANSFGLNATWRPTTKIIVRGNAGWLNREYLSSPGLSTTRREDKTTNQSVSVAYAAHDRLMITLAATNEHRASDLPSAVYTTRGVSLVADLNF
jgi:Putative beta-barrel porin 2